MTVTCLRCREKRTFLLIIMGTVVSIPLIWNSLPSTSRAKVFLNERVKSVLSLTRFSSANSYSSALEDLTKEFEGEMKTFTRSFSILKALEKDGYMPLRVSEKRSPITGKTKTATTITTAITRQIPTRTQLQTNEHRLTTFTVSTKSPTKTLSPSVDAKPKKTQQSFLVPNVVHYVSIGSDLNFSFTNYLSYRSVERFIQPELIFVYGENIPTGKWWNRTIQEVKNIYHVNKTYSGKAPNGKAFKFPAHISDYLRAEILLRYGGIYLDADVIVVKSFDPLRQYPATLGREKPNALCNGIMIAKRGAPFLRLILEQYRSYLGQQEHWAVKSVYNLDTLARLYPHMIHVEETSLNRPNWAEIGWIYDNKCNWSNNYAVHLWIRLWPPNKRPNGMEDILSKNTTFGEIARLAIFGSTAIRNNTF